MKVSVAMATYNGAAYVAAQLDSLVRQTRLPDELVVVDDGSRDDTVAIVERFARTAPFAVQIARNAENLGYAQNFGHAVGLCDGDVVFPCDQDDVWFDAKIATLVAALDARPATAAVLCNALLADADLQTSGATKLDRIRAGGLPDTAHVMGCCIALRRSLLDIALPIPADVRAHDNWIMALADAAGVACRLEQPLQFYRLHGANASDFFVNRVEAPSVLDRATARVRRILNRFRARGGMAAEHALLSEVHNRIDDHVSDFAALVGASRADAVRDRLRDRTETLSQRLAIRGTARRHRPVSVLSLWRSGAYGTRRTAAGAALKDLVWPRLTDEWPDR